MRRRPSPTASSIRPPVLMLVALVAAVLALGGCSGGGEPDDAPSSADPVADNPYAGRTGFADPASRTAQAAAQAKADGDVEAERVLSRLASTPQGIWLTPEEYPPGSVAPLVARVVRAADAAGQVPTFVVYGIPDRDCTGGFSGGGLTADQYGPWVQEIADAVSGADPSVPVVAVVEPDALASAIACDRRSERVRLIADAVTRLADAEVTTYVDGGHSHWIEPDQLARLLEQAGIDQARGFATNVSNYQTDADERAYGEQLSALLDGAHYIVDTGRNGNGSTEDWCNPTGRAYGTDPAPAPEGDAEHLDAYVWVKPPGESDGECGGGPPAGRFWRERALEMAVSSGW
ncbi:MULTISPECIES: glycoside hydrolase family 6 protein [unclassified Nocardioides]|uniref:glycoside hydrolase family 6 protein n=1 Tax=unclassified Nocardioides TaxID=2615069 RepID=UPI0000EB63A1|nr:MULTISPECIES: glycoside hydrolase family 6 protein [unclassified Nocardioides]ABL83001.1 Cellulase [Nocardioides sp. JS614]